MTQIIYIFAILIALWLGYMAEKTNKKMLLYFLIALLTFVAGFRGISCGVDTPSYYENIIKGFPYPWMFREEGFRVTATFLMDKFNNPQLMFVLCALITNFFVLMRLWDFRDEAKFGFMNLLYLLLYYSNSMNIMRQYVAVAIIFYGTRFLKNKKPLFILSLIIGFTFHRSSLLAIGYLGIALWIGFTKKQKLIFSMPIVLIFAISIGYVRTYLESDINTYSSQVVDNINITYFYLLFITLFVLVTYEANVGIRLTEYSTLPEKTNNKVKTDIVLYVLIGLAFNALSMFFEFVGRTGLYYSIYDIVFWGIACKKFRNAKLNTVLIIIYAVYIFVIDIVRNGIKLFPYEIFFY